MRLPKLKRGDAILVEWIDAHFLSDAGWRDEAEYVELEPITITTVCQFIMRDRDYIYTVADRSKTEPIGIMRDLRIPIGCLRRVTKL
ncbi:MAG TPA: hypothetical protein PKH81_06930 [Treponemataceae bacterium]|nr:hypothetical protein [Treponemataceae bacterium]